MKLKAYILATASTVSILACGSALAQTAPAASTDAAAAPADSAIVVTGMRKSLQSSRNLKKNSDQIVDAVVASEIGKLPDTAVSDSLARVTGVQVTRDGGEADGILVRGLPNIATSYNGRDIFTAEGRFVASQDFAAGNVAALEVYKSTTPDQVEGGIAGLINVRGRRPFDFKGLEVSGMLNELYATQSKHYAPNGNLLISDRWHTNIGEIGALVNVSFNELHYIDSKRFIGSFVSATIDPNLTPNPSVDGGRRFADDPGINYSEHDRTRPSANAALQWRPNDNTELYADFLYQGYDSKTSDRNLEFPLWGGSQYSDVQLTQDGSTVQSMTVTNPFRPQGWQAATHDHTDTYQIAVGGKWDHGPWTITTDLASTQSHYLLSIYSWDFAFTSSPTAHVNYDADGGVDVTLGGFDTTNPNNLKFRGFYDRQLWARGRDVQFRTDAEYRTTISWLPKVRMGVRFVDRKAGFDNGDRYNNVEGLNLTMPNTGLDIQTTQPGFVGEDYPTIRSWAAPTYDSIRDNVASIRTLVGFPAGVPPYNPAQHFTADEKSSAAYIQGHYAFDAGVPIDGVVGVRVVKTDEAETSSQRTSDSSYTDALPSASMRIHLSDKTQIRLAANKTRTRPNFADLNPNYVVNAGQSPVQYDGQIYYRNGGGSGNIDLKPYTAKNLDATFEHYFGSTGIVSIDVFDRVVDGFINYHPITIKDTDFTDNPTPDPLNNNYATDTQNVKITVPYNAAQVKFKGAEIQYTSFFDYDFLPTWAANFGIQANLTYMEGRQKVLAGTAANDIPGDLNQPGVSRLSYNLTGMYENGPWSARLAYNARSKWLNVCDTVNSWAANPGCEYTRGTKRFDFSGSYKLSDNLSLSLDMNNLFAKPLSVYRVYQNTIAGGTGGFFNTQVRTEETVYSVGIHFRY